MTSDPRTPVIVGVGQAAERVGDAGYRGMSAVDLATAAVQAALSDCAAPHCGAVTEAIDVVAGTRQFEITGRDGPGVLGRSTNYPRSVANRVGAGSARAVLDVVGGQGPQRLLNEFAAAIAAGDIDAALLFGSDNSSTLRHLAGAEPKPDFTEVVDGQLEDRGYGLDDVIDGYLIFHGMTSPAAQFGVMENARRSRLGVSPREYLCQMGELMAPFTKVAAKNPFAASPVERSVDQLTTVNENNRLICAPYPRLMVARDLVNQGAAALVMSVAAAQRLGVPKEKWVYLCGHADMTEQPLLARPDLGRSRTAEMAVHEALSVAGISAAEIATFDLYSCFPISVFDMCDHLGIAPQDSRGLTLTGGLPYFGGAGNNYSMHAIAETVGRMRCRPGDFGLVSAIGGLMSKCSIGVYTCQPQPWRRDRSREMQEEITSWPTETITYVAEGDATIETYSVHYDWPATTGVIVGRLDSDNSRFIATSEDEDLVALLAEGESIGEKVVVRALEYGNRVSLK